MKLYCHCCIWHGTSCWAGYALGMLLMVVFAFCSAFGCHLLQCSARRPGRKLRKQWTRKKKEAEENKEEQNRESTWENSVQNAEEKHMQRKSTWVNAHLATFFQRGLDIALTLGLVKHLAPSTRPDAKHVFITSKCEIFNAKVALAVAPRWTWLIEPLLQRWIAHR